MEIAEEYLTPKKSGKKKQQHTLEHAVVGQH